ncbi:hypothetical protein BG004_008224 [Podila humilis]|nr:hypothetical protein BG004_008224 [Podila humilis]
MSFLTRTALSRTSLSLAASKSSSSTSLLLVVRHKSTATSSESTTSPAARSPELFDQTIVLSNGATFTLRTPSPRSQIRLTRDTRNHPLWNPDLSGNASSDDSGQLSKFAKKFGDLDGFGDLEFADGGDVDRKALTAKQIAQAAPAAGKGKGKKK